MTAMISFMIAAATIVPDTIVARAVSVTVKVETAIPVNTRDTPEWGNNVNPRYFDGCVCFCYSDRKSVV